MESPTFFCRVLDRDNPRTQSGMYPWLRLNANFSLNRNKPGVLSKVIHSEHWCIVYSCNLSSPAGWRPLGWRSSRLVDAGEEEVRTATETVPQGRNGQAVSSVPAGTSRCQPVPVTGVVTAMCSRLRKEWRGAGSLEKGRGPNGCVIRYPETI